MPGCDRSIGEDHDHDFHLVLTHQLLELLLPEVQDRLQGDLDAVVAEGSQIRNGRFESSVR